jgi:hypothetical protein
MAGHVPVRPADPPKSKQVSLAKPSTSGDTRARTEPMSRHTTAGRQARQAQPRPAPSVRAAYTRTDLATWLMGSLRIPQCSATSMAGSNGATRPRLHSSANTLAPLQVKPRDVALVTWSIMSGRWSVADPTIRTTCSGRPRVRPKPRTNSNGSVGFDFVTINRNQNG